MGKDYRDASMVIVKPRFAGFCGSDRGIWFRRAFGDMIQSTLAAEGKDARVIGHELLGEVVEAGPEATRDFGLRPGDVVSTESHIICNTCYQCRIGDNHVCATDRIIGISVDGCFAEYVKLPGPGALAHRRAPRSGRRWRRSRSRSATPCTPAPR